MSGTSCKIQYQKSTGGKQTALFSPETAGEGQPTREKGEFAILCRFCGHVITRQKERLEVRGNHRHVFANPHGLVFRIRCFHRAPGCLCAGIPTNEFTWFSGFSWQVVICGRCTEHMGWRFSSNGSYFHGLIAGHLVEGPSGQI